MDTLYLACKHCGIRVSNFLEQSRQQWSWTEFNQMTEQKLVQSGYYVRNNHRNYILNLADKRNLSNHPDLDRFNGCCGPGFEGEPNLICSCKKEIGREVSDCSSPYLIYVNKAVVYEVTDDWNLFPLLQQVESEQLIICEQMQSILSLIRYGQVKEAIDWLRETLQLIEAEGLLNELNTLPSIQHFNH
jgi:hypothetical protein